MISPPNPSAALLRKEKFSLMYVFGGPHSDDFSFANLGRCHICRAHLGVAGQQPVNLI